MYGSTVDRATFYHDFNDQRGYTLLSIVQHGNSAIAALEKLRTVQSVAVTATESTQATHDGRLTSLCRRSRPTGQNEGSQGI